MTNFEARIKDGAIKFELVRERDEFANHLLANEGDFIDIKCSKKGDRPRTKKQNDSMHKYFSDMSQILNDSGISVAMFLEYFEVDFTPEVIKNIWQKIGLKKFEKGHTSKWNRNQLTEVYDEFNRGSSLHGIHLPFPNKLTEIKELDEAIEYEENTLEENNWK